MANKSPRYNSFLLLEDSIGDKRCAKKYESRGYLGTIATYHNNGRITPGACELSSSGFLIRFAFFLVYNTFWIGFPLVMLTWGFKCFLCWNIWGMFYQNFIGYIVTLGFILVPSAPLIINFGQFNSLKVFGHCGVIHLCDLCKPCSLGSHVLFLTGQLYTSGFSVFLFDLLGFSYKIFQLFSSKSQFTCWGFEGHDAF